MPAKNQKKNRLPSGIFPVFMAMESKLKQYLQRYLVRQQDIEDVLQDTFVRAYESEKEQEIRSPRSYLFKVAKHIALNEVTKKSYQLMSYVGDMEELNVIDDTLVGEEALAQQQRLAVLNRAIADLPPQCQRVIILRKIFGFSQKEVAERLNITVKTVEKHLTKGLRRCQETLNAEDEEQVNKTVTHETPGGVGKTTNVRRYSDE